MYKPCFSIITINYNNAGALKQTFDSVRRQTFKEMDYVVIDGGSKDDSLKIIEENRDLLAFYCSEKDNGIYDAQNKGILQSKGRYLLFLNSGDVFASDDFLEKVFAFIEKNSNKKFIYADTILRNRDESLYEIVQPDKLDLFFFYNKTLNHQSCLIERSLFTAYGLYNPIYKICGDFDFILNVFMRDGKQFAHFNKFAVIYENNGFSADPTNYQTVVNERRQIIDKYFSSQQKSDCEKKERALKSWQANTKKRLYDHPFSYWFIKLYVKMKGLHWKK